MAFGLRQLASANLTAMIAQFPFQTSDPIARELRYTYTNLWILSGKPYGKPTFGADEATLKNMGGIPRPDVVVAGLRAAATPRPMSVRASDSLSTQAGEAQEHGGTADLVVDMRSTAASLAEAEVALEQAQSTAAVIMSVLGAAAALHKMFTTKTTNTLGEWTRSTGAVGPTAPEASVLQVNFILFITGEKWKTESKNDFIAHAVLTNADGAKVESRQALQLYTVGDKPRYPPPVDAVPVAKGLLPAEKQPFAKKLQDDDIWNPYLAVVMSAALSELRQQVVDRKR